MKPPDDDTADRRPVWMALSELFLDTDPAPSRQARIDILATSPYSLEELHAILVEEVYPACAANLRSVAGEWSGFDPVWLERTILERASNTSRWAHLLHPGRITMRRWAEWQALKRDVQTAREAGTAVDPRRPC